MPKTTPWLDKRQTPSGSTTLSKAGGSRLKSLYGTFGPLIYSRCRRALNDEALAVSATQEVFARVLQELDTLSPRGAVEVLTSACEGVCRELGRPLVH